MFIFLIHAPSDTPKRPLIKKKKRIIYKVLTFIISIVYTICALKIDINYVHNAFLASMIIQSVLIHPLTYKIFKLPYNNYTPLQKTITMHLPYYIRDFHQNQGKH